MFSLLSEHWVAETAPQCYQTSLTGEMSSLDVPPRGENPLPLLAACAASDEAQDTVGFHIASSCWASCPPAHLPGHSCQGCSQSILFPVFVLGLHWHVQDLALGIVELHKDYTSPSETSPGPSRWHPFPPECQQHHTGWCPWQSCRGCTGTTVHVTDKDVKQVPVPTPEEWRLSLVCWVTELLTATLQVQPSSQSIFTKWSSCQIHASNVKTRMLCGTVWKALHRSSWVTSVALPYPSAL